MSSRSPRDVARALAGRLPNPARRRLTIELHRSRLGQRIGRDAPFVTAVVAATDLHAPYLAECLDSIRRQSWPAYEIIIVPYGDATRCREIAERYAGDWRCSIARSAGSHGAALNAGARRGRGEYLTFVGAADVVPADAFEQLVDSLSASGSDFAAGNYIDEAPEKYLTRSEHARAHERDRRAVTLTEVPDALTDVFEGNRMFRRTFWTGARLAFPERATAPRELPIERAYVLASSFDLLERVTYRWTKRGDGVPFGTLRPVASGLHEWRTEQRRTLAELEDRGDADLLDAWLYGILDTGIRAYLADVERLSEQDWAVLRDAAAQLWERAPDRVRRRVRPESRVGAWLAAQGLRSHLEDFVAQRWFEHGQYPSVIRNGVAYALLPYAMAGDELDVPSSCYVLTERETRPTVSVQRINWTDDVLRLDLFCYIVNVSMPDEAPDVDVVLVRGEQRIALEVSVVADPAVTRHAGQPYQCYDYGAVTATLPLARLAEVEHGGWTLEAAITAAGITRTSAATQLGWQGSAAALRSHRDHAVEATPRWDRDRGLIVELAEPPVPVEESAAEPAARGFAIEHVTLDGTTIDLYGSWTSEPSDSWVLSLESGAVRLEATPVFADEGRWHLRFDATADPWSLGRRPVPPGAYHLRCGDGDRTHPVEYADALLDRLPYDVVDEVFRMRPRRSPPGRPVLELGIPLSAHEQGPYAQDQLQRVYAAEHDIDGSLAYFQSYAGQSATDSPLALYSVLREKRPDLKVYWGIADHSQRVPDGAIPVLIRSREYYAALATAKYVVSNIDFERWFVRREGQYVLQTYHGCPSKTMGIGLWQEKRFTPRRIEQQLGRTSYLWDALLSPTPEMNRYYRDAFRYRGTILDRGYPRDDVLRSPAAHEIRADVRERLGIDPEQTAVLYAPTWRDDVATGYRSAPLTSDLDLAAAAERLGDGFVFLLRGHRFHGSVDARSGRAIDVSGYPEINDLILASDAAVLDYSSLRFDYAVTRKPMIFHVPDLDAYTGGVRGFLYDFEPTAPGPFVDNTDGVISELRRLDEVAARYAETYDAFNATYSRWQDGHAAERVVDAFFTPR